MTGTYLNITHNSDEIVSAFNQLLQSGQDLTPAMAEIGSYLELQTRDHFDNEEAPDGTPWAPLSPTTLKFRAEKGLPIDRILHGETLNLRDEIHTTYDSDSVEISSGQPAQAYAAMQQFGGTTSPDSMIPGVDIPARPFFGYSDQDEEYILEVLSDFLTDFENV